MAEERSAAGKRIQRPDALRLGEQQRQRLKRLRGDALEQHYPAAAREQAVDGTVILDVVVNEDGQVVEAQVLSEDPPGHGFALAALDAVKTFEFDNPWHRLVVMEYAVTFYP